MRIVLMIILLFKVFCSFSKAPINDDFVQVFEKETLDKKKAKDLSLMISTGPETLPAWFWQLPVSDSVVVYSIGISDPLSDITLGRLQAMARAQMLASQMFRLSVSGIADHYSKDDIGKFEEINKYRALQNGRLKHSIVDSFKTKFNEQVILLRTIIENKDTLCFETQAEQYKSVNHTRSGWQQFEKTSFIFSIDTLSLKYCYFSNQKDFEIETSVNSKPIEIPYGMYSYQQDSGTIISMPHKGLWFAYIQAFCNSLVEMSSMAKSNSQTVEQVSNSQKLSQINRNVFSNSFAFRIKKVSIVEESLRFEIQKIK